MKEPTPNYNIMLDSAVCSLQNAYADYKKAVVDSLRMTWIDKDGVLTVLDGMEAQIQKADELKREVMRLMFKVREIKDMAEAESEEI